MVSQPEYLNQRTIYHRKSLTSSQLSAKLIQPHEDYQDEEDVVVAKLIKSLRFCSATLLLQPAVCLSLPPFTFWPILLLISPLLPQDCCALLAI